MLSNRDPEIAFVFRKLALQAGDAIMAIYNGPEFQIDAKADASPVTEADRAADALIAAGLRAAFPTIALVTEEQAATHALRAREFLIVDPLDGTKEFIQRRGDFTVNIALVQNGVPVCGVVYAPAKGRLFQTMPDGTATEEIGPFDPDRPGARKPLLVRNADNDKLVVVASKSHRDQATEDYINRYTVSDSRAAGSSLKFCLVAGAEADLYPRLGPTMEWDTAAGDAVLRAAGGQVLDMATGQPLTYGKPGFRNPHFVALGAQVVLKG
jgi:3'(2'), 5'-bisphosphate nucleotidase